MAQAEYRGNVMSGLEILSPAKCIVGESPLWDEKNRQLLMVDIQGRRLRKIKWDTLKTYDTVLEQEIGFVVLGKSNNVIAGAEDGVYCVADDGGFSRVSKPCKIKGLRFNDGKVAPDGRLYLGTFSRDRSAAFYCMKSDGEIIELFDGVGNSNGLDWSPDGKQMYYNDTPTGKTEVFDFCDGTLKNRKDIIKYTHGNPDGMTIDSDGNLWVALWGSGLVVCVNPKSGKIIKKLELPVSQPASCAFAGDDLKCLVITTAAHGVNLREEPLAGSVFAIKTEAQGVPVVRLKDF